jgi:hypothetical protein
VLAPLAALAPDLREPFAGATLQERWRERAPILPKLEQLDKLPD